VRSDEPALRQRLRPAPIWMPLTTGTGVTLLAQLIMPVILMIPTRAATTMPAAAVVLREKFLAMATAAIAFMGWTGSGMPKPMPVRILAAPVNRRVEGREIEFWIVRAVIKGRRVPRSPREPESSARGWVRRVRRLWRVVWRRWERKERDFICEAMVFLVRTRI